MNSNVLKLAGASLLAIPPLQCASVGRSDLRSIIAAVPSRKRRRHWLRQVRREEVRQMGNMGAVYEAVAYIGFTVASFYVMSRLVRRALECESEVSE